MKGREAARAAGAQSQGATYSHGNAVKRVRKDAKDREVCRTRSGGVGCFALGHAFFFCCATKHFLASPRFALVCPSPRPRYRPNSVTL
ncbi:hypothetical protein ACJQWK_00228 [Exserohilum turcicum]